MSKLDDQRKAKKKAFKDLEIIEALGQDNERKGAKEALKFHKEQVKESEKKDILTVEKLDSAHSKDSYYQTILSECNLRMSEYQLPMGFGWRASVSDKGLAIYIGTPYGTYGGGVKIVGDPFIDAKGTVGLVNQALMDVDMLHDQWKIQSSIKTKN